MNGTLNPCLLAHAGLQPFRDNKTGMNTMIFYFTIRGRLCIFIQVPEKLDAIVIGSGIGGLTTAAIMSKVLLKHLVLFYL